jgi:hypothetical protein
MYQRGRGQQALNRGSKKYLKKLKKRLDKPLNLWYNKYVIKRDYKIKNFLKELFHYDKEDDKKGQIYKVAFIRRG